MLTLGVLLLGIRRGPCIGPDPAVRVACFRACAGQLSPRPASANAAVLFGRPQRREAGNQRWDQAARAESDQARNRNVGAARSQ